MKAVMDFHEKYYSSNLMTLAVIAPLSLDELQTIVEEYFLEIPNRNAEMPFWPENPYGPEQLQTKVEIVPVSDLRSISVTFPIPYTVQYYRTSVSLIKIAELLLLARYVCFTINY
jgi:insulysin